MEAVQEVVIIPEIIWRSVVARLENIEKHIERKEKSPLEIQWVTREQAAQILNRDVQTVTKMATKQRLFEYRKSARKIEFSLPSIKEYQKKTGVSLENINIILKK